MKDLFTMASSKNCSMDISDLVIIMFRFASLSYGMKNLMMSLSVYSYSQETLECKGID